MAEKIADNSYMIIFLALLWAVVTLVSRAGGSQAYGRWAGKRLKSKRSALLATSLFGLLVFIDDGLYSYSMERKKSLGTPQNPAPKGFEFWGSDINVTNIQLDAVKSIWD